MALPYMAKMVPVSTSFDVYMQCRLKISFIMLCGFVVDFELCAIEQNYTI